MTAAASQGTGGAHSDLVVPEAIQQIAFADRILMNKIDLVTPAELGAITDQV